MILYHGSNIRVDTIDLSKSKPFKDFGKGFYFSDSSAQALEMAKFKALQLGGEPIISTFEFDYDRLQNSGLKSLIFDSYSEPWIDFIIRNRSSEEVHQYDFVYGPIADDKVGRQMRLYFDRDIDKQQLLERLKYFKGITFQYYFATENSLQFLKRIF